MMDSSVAIVTLSPGQHIVTGGEKVQDEHRGPGTRQA